MNKKLYLFTIISAFSSILYSECTTKKTIINPVEPKDTTTTTIITMPTDTIFKYLALGDSYTKAQGEAPENAYPVLFIERLKEQGIEVDTQKTIAQTGWRTDNLKTAINMASLPNDFDLVSLLIGVNNQYQGRSIEEYKVQFEELLNISISLAKGKKENVIVLSIPDYGATPFGASNATYIGEQIDLFNAANKEITEAYGIRYFDITPISREAKNDATLTCSDNLHPSAKMYGLWVDLIFEDAKEIITQ